MKFIHNHNRFIKFALVGISGTVVDLGFFNFFVYILEFSDKTSYSLSFILAVLNNFFLNRNWTFPESKKNRVSGQLIKFAFVSVIGLLIRDIFYPIIEGPILSFVITFFPKTSLISPEFLSGNFTLGIIITVVLFWNYFVNRFWTYRNLDFSQRREENGP